MAVSDKQEIPHVIVAPQGFAERLAQLLGAPGGCCFDNVYEGLAEALVLAGQGAVVLTVMVDHLPRGHMALFGALAGVEQVRSQAVSLTGRQVKLVQAAEAGAGEVFGLAQERLVRWGGAGVAETTGPALKEVFDEPPAAPPAEAGLETLAREIVRQSRQGEESARQRHVVEGRSKAGRAGGPEDSNAAPLLSEDELNALMR